MFWRLISLSNIRVDIRNNCKSLIYISFRYLVLLIIRVRFPVGRGTSPFAGFLTNSGTFPVSYTTIIDGLFLREKAAET
jgi:hypothetical protein